MRAMPEIVNASAPFHPAQMRQIQNGSGYCKREYCQWTPLIRAAPQLPNRRHIILDDHHLALIRKLTLRNHQITQIAPVRPRARFFTKDSISSPTIKS